MRLTLRLLAILIALIMILLSIEGIAFERRETEDLKRDVGQSQARIEFALKRSIQAIAAASKSGEEIPAIEAFCEDFQNADKSLVLRLVHPARPVRPDASPESAVVPRGDASPSQESGAKAPSRTVSLDLRCDPELRLEISDESTRLKKIESKVISRLAIFMAALIVGGGIAASILGVMFVGRPLKRLVAKTQAIAAGDFKTPVGLHGGDELGELGVALDRMGESLATAHERIIRETGERIAALEQLRHADRLKTVGQFASGIAHELGTPLNVILGRASLIGGGALGESDLKRSAQVIGEQASRMTSLIRQFLEFARRGSPRRERSDLAEIVVKTRDLMNSLGDKGRIDAVVAKGDCRVEVDPAQIQQVITNLVVNALQAVGKQGTVRVSCERVRGAQDSQGSAVSDADFVRLRVEDDGVGIPEDVLPRIFDPFFTTKDVGQGTGLGLSIVHGIVRDHGGHIAVHSVEGTGTRFDVFLPVAGAQTETQR